MFTIRVEVSMRKKKRKWRGALAWVPKKVQCGRLGQVGHVEFLEKFA